MNELIRQIEKQCWDHQSNCVDTEKFAEMIVLECVQQCESLADIAENINSGEIARKTKATAHSCGKMIKLRFGVK